MKFSDDIATKTIIKEEVDFKEQIIRKIEIETISIDR